MGWAARTIEKLMAGQTVKIRPHGNSMSGKIENGDLVTITPITATVETGDIVLCKVNGREYLHLVKAVSDERYLIGNNHGRINGWTKQIFGKVIKVEK